ncbi:MAG: hypothetical protein ABIJ21_03285 [Nanoarchaeota archaeon]
MVLSRRAFSIRSPPLAGIILAHPRKAFIIVSPAAGRNLCLAKHGSS